MSSRNYRKLYGSNDLPPPDESSEDEYEPLYAKSSPTKFKYQGLELSSHSEDESDNMDDASMDSTDYQAYNKTQKRKIKKKKQKAKQIPKATSNESEMDEIDRSVMEVNAMLGAPPEPSSSVEKPQPKRGEALMAIHKKHLNSVNELNRLFGPAPAERGKKSRRGRAQPNVEQGNKKGIIVSVALNPDRLKSIGLSMSVNRRDGRHTYFTFDHNGEYQRLHRIYMDKTRYSFVRLDNMEAQTIHVEAHVAKADMFFEVDEYNQATRCIEEAIAYMQYYVHPLFSVTDNTNRLEYKFIENRAFHVAVFKYMYLLTNRACHRTALELAKILLNLDPSDPLAVILVIDTIALRAREHQWLIEAIDHWSQERQAGFLFNMQYSYAMAHFHIATKKKGDMTQADNLIQEAILNYPYVLMNILKCFGTNLSAKLQGHPLFDEASHFISKNLKDLITVYAKFSSGKWRERPVMEWLTRNADIVADKFNTFDEVKQQAVKRENANRNWFQKWPPEVKRHLCVITPMMNLLFDESLVQVRSLYAADPVPPADSVNRYNYGRLPNNPEVTDQMLLNFFMAVVAPPAQQE